MKFGQLMLDLVLLMQFVTCSQLLQVNDKNFKEIVIESGKYTFVDFYADWCRHCKNLMPVVEQLHDLFKDEPNIQVVKINGDKDGRRMVKKYNIDGFPDLKLFHGGDEPVNYVGRRDLESFSNFIQAISGVKLKNKPKLSEAPKEEVKLLPNTIQLDDSNFEEKVLNSNIDTVVFFSAPWCKYCEEVKEHWKKITSNIFINEKSVQFGMIELGHETTLGLKQQYNIKSIPSILFFKGKKKTEPVLFKGKDLEPLVNFVNTNAGLKRKINGRLENEAGNIKTIDKLVFERLKISDNKEATAVEILSELSQLIKQAKSVNEDLSMGAYYKKLLNKVLTGEQNYFSNELNRLTNALKYDTEGMQPVAIDSLQKRSSILKYFV